MDSSANPKTSRWGDGHPAIGILQQQDTIPSMIAEKRPSSSFAEPAYKKARSDFYGQQQQDIVYTGGPGAYLMEAPAPLEERSASLGQTYAANFSTGDGTYGAGYGGAVLQNQKPASFAPGSAKGSGTGALFYKTKLCMKFKLGSCTFNERCHFAHGVEDLRKPPPGWEDMVKLGATGTTATKPTDATTPAARRSNKPCRYFVEGNCPYGDKCTFSHGNEDAQRGSASGLDLSGTSNGSSGSSRTNFKTRLCARWEKGEVCNYGDKCHFAHGQAELRSYTGGSSYGGTNMSDSAAFSDPNKVNQPTLSDPYSLSLNYSNIGGAYIPSSNINTYSAAGANANSYAALQVGINGYSSNYNYSNWNTDNKSPTVNPPVSAISSMPSQGYVQTTSAASWSGNYSVDGGYDKTGTGTSNYIQGLQQQQNVPYYVNGSNFQTTNQNPPTAQDSGQSNYQSAAKNIDGGTYYGSTYANQQTGYVGGYNPV